MPHSSSRDAPPESRPLARNPTVRPRSQRAVGGCIGDLEKKSKRGGALQSEGKGSAGPAKAAQPLSIPGTKSKHKRRISECFAEDSQCSTAARDSDLV